MSTSPSLIRVLTVDDHALLREGIAALVNAEPDMELVAERPPTERKPSNNFAGTVRT